MSEMLGAGMNNLSAATRTNLKSPIRHATKSNTNEFLVFSIANICHSGSMNKNPFDPDEWRVNITTAPSFTTRILTCKISISTQK